MQCPDSLAGKSEFICSLSKHLLKAPSWALGGGSGGVSANDQDLSSIPEALTLWHGKQAERNDKHYDNY